MEAIILVGVQASGKSSFFRDRFCKSHVLISLDMLRTRKRERRFLDLCLETRQRFVVDNTNPCRSDRSIYIESAKLAGFAVQGYYFRSQIAECLRRNAGRIPRVPDVAILGTFNRLEIPAIDEGFDSLHYVSLQNVGFKVDEWQDEV